MAWVLLLLWLAPHGIRAASIQLRRTKLVSDSPHDADWFRSLSGSDRPFVDDAKVLQMPRPAKPVTLTREKVTERSRNLRSEESRSPGLKILQNSTAASSTASNVSNVTVEPSVPLPALREVKGNLTCKDPGCAANVLLQIYDPQEEYVRDCNLSLSVHATDFDSNFDGERVMNFMGNSRAMGGGDCFPAVNGCVSNQSRELLFPCIREHPVSTILTDQGNILVSAQITSTVDECPFQGNLLHGVTTVVCYVGLLADLTTTTVPPNATTTTTTHWLSAEDMQKYPKFVRQWLAEHPGMSLKDMPGYESILNMSQKVEGVPVSIGALPFRRNLSSAYASAAAAYYGAGGSNYDGSLGAGSCCGPGRGLVLESDGSFNLSTRGFLRCAEKGCKTNVLLDFNRTLVSINQCNLQLWFNQTDFDNKDGAVEFLTVKVGGKEVLDQVKPGGNPCRSAYDGHPLKPKEIQIHAVKDMDITEAVQLGPVDIAAEISKQVDECPSNGYLLDASIQVSCNVFGIGALLQLDRVSVADVLTLNKALLDGDLAQQDETFKEFLVVAKTNKTNETSAINATNETTLVQK